MIFRKYFFRHHIFHFLRLFYILISKQGIHICRMDLDFCYIAVILKEFRRGGGRSGTNGLATLEYFDLCINTVQQFKPFSWIISRSMMSKFSANLSATSLLLRLRLLCRLVLIIWQNFNYIRCTFYVLNFNLCFFLLCSI